jgi:hypothetical protein
MQVETHSMPVIGHVIAAKQPGDDEMPNGPIDFARFSAIEIEEAIWNELEKEGIAEDMSLLATGFINRAEEGAIEAKAMDKFIALIESKAPYVSDALGEWLRKVRDMALAARKRNVPVLFFVE